MSTTEDDVIPFAEKPPEPAPAKKPRPTKPQLADAPLWPAPEEASGRNWLVIMTLVAIIGLFAWMLSFFYAGAHGGVDQAGYLMTARLIAGDKNDFAPRSPAVAAPPATLPASAPKMAVALAEKYEQEHPLPAPIQTNHFFDGLRNRLSFVPETPFQFASRMCIMTEPYGPANPTQPAQYRYFAKYPFGFPLLAAIGRWLGGVDGMYWVNPLCTILACYFAYFLFRQAVSPFMSLIGVLWLATNPLVFNYANDANSHASTLFFVTVGFWGLLSWLRTRQLWRGCIGAFALGYACTIRYSEFLLILPIACAALMHFRFTWRRTLESLAILFAWSIPIAALATVCWVSFGAPWKTGYTYCHESTGFAWKYLTGDFGEGVLHQGNWETFTMQLNHTGLFLLWPLALAGIFAMLGSAWRLGAILALWIIPSTLLYMLYYWAPTAENTVGYLRFFMSILPGMIFAGLWLLERALSAIKGETRASLIAATCLGLFVLVAAAMFVDQTTLEGFPQIFAQIPLAVWHLATHTWLGLFATLGLLALIAGIWYFEADYAASRTALALGAGALTAFGCGVNLYFMTPNVETGQAHWLGLRVAVDNLRETTPKGSVILAAANFNDDQLLNQLDAVGNWTLINASLFNSSSFSAAKIRIDRIDKDKDGEEDPDPIQIERSRFYLELLGKPNAIGTLIPLRPPELMRYRKDLIDHYMDADKRIFFVVSTRAKSETVTRADRDELLTSPTMGNFTPPPGFHSKLVRTWEPPTSDPAAMVNLGRWNRMALINNRNINQARPIPEIFGLFEIVRDSPPVDPLTKSKHSPAELSKSPTTMR